MTADVPRSVAANVIRRFAQWLHVDSGLAASTVQGYLTQVATFHTQRDCPAPTAGPGWRQLRDRLRAAGRQAPFKAWSVNPALIRWAYPCAEDSHTLADAALVAWFAALRPIEMLAQDSGDPSARQISFAQGRIRWCRRDGRPCHPDHPGLDYVLLHVYRKGDAFAGHWLPLFRSGFKRCCPVTAIRRQWHRAGRPLDGPIFARFPDGSCVRRRHLSVFLRDLAADARLPVLPFSPYALRRGCITTMAAIGIAPHLRCAFVGHRPASVPAGETAVHVGYVDPAPAHFRDVARQMARARIFITAQH